MKREKRKMEKDGKKERLKHEINQSINQSIPRASTHPPQTIRPIYITNCTPSQTWFSTCPGGGREGCSAAQGNQSKPNISKPNIHIQKQDRIQNTPRSLCSLCSLVALHSYADRRRE